MDGQQRSPVTVTISKDKVLELINAHEKYIPPGENKSPICGLPEADSASRYCTSSKQADQLPAYWEREVERLVRNLEDLSNPLMMPEAGQPTKATYQGLSDAADVLCPGAMISDLDNSSLMFQHYSNGWDANCHGEILDAIQCKADDDPPYFRDADITLCAELVDLVTSAIARLATQAFQSDFCSSGSWQYLQRSPLNLRSWQKDQR